MKILYSVATEIRYQIYSKIILALSAIITLVLILNIYSNMNSINYLYEQYEHSKNYYIQTGQNVELALSGEANTQETVNSDGTSTVMIENTLKYDYDNLSKAISINRPKYLLINILEYSRL